MWGKTFWKEWKEKINIFFLALVFQVIFVFLALTHSSQKEFIELLTLTMILAFFPLVGLLLGSSAFYSEFKDGAWAFLFSRPVPKWKVWLSKYLSLLSILLSLLAVFFFLSQVLPQVKEILESYQFPVQFVGQRISLLLLGVLFPVYAFTIAFSISFLSEKQFVIIFSSLFLLIILDLIAYFYQKNIFSLLPPTLLFSSGIFKELFLLLTVLVASSFFLASILTFSKADFSQPKKKILFFGKFLFLFLLISVAVNTVWIGAKAHFGGKDYIHSWQLFEGDAYFSSNKGIYKFAAKEERLKKIGKPVISFNPFSLAKGKMAFLAHRLKNDQVELWLMNQDGSQRKRLAWRSQSKESPFYQLNPSSCFLSPDGEKIAWTALPPKGQAPLLFWMNSDGRRMRSRPLAWPSVGYKNFKPEIIAWTENNNIVLLLRELGKSGLSFPAILIFNPETETSTILTERISRPYEIAVSPGQNYLAYCYRNETENKEVLSLLSLNPLEKEKIYIDDFIVLRGLAWSRDEGKLAFSVEKSKTELFLAVYSLKEKRVVSSKELSQDEPCLYPLVIDWIFKNQKLVLNDPCHGYIQVLDEKLNEEKRIKTPASLKKVLLLFALDKGVLFKERERARLWELNLEAEEWKRVY